MALYQGLFTFLINFALIANGCSSSIQPTIIAHFNDVGQRPNLSEYLHRRQEIVNNEIAMNFESDVVLTDRELLANKIIMEAKNIEIYEGLRYPKKFIPARHLFDVLDDIKQSKLFQIIKKMPKGGILHAHDTALTSIDYIVNITYRENLWQCNRTATGIVEFIFSRTLPTTSNNCTWKLVKDARELVGINAYDKYVRSLFTLYTKKPHEDFKDINEVWIKFTRIFILFAPIVTYAPVWKDYYKQALKEAEEDGVQYLEFRSILPALYDLDGHHFGPIDVVKLYVEGLEEYQRDHKYFIGSKLIYAPIKQVENTTVAEYMTTIKDLQYNFPKFIAGFDLVGQEDLGRDLIEFAAFLLELPDNIKFYFHAGETNWFGSIDENLYDAVAMGTVRVGHGYALYKHPTLLHIMKEKDIAIEVNPVSNQVLKLVEDHRNHPGALFFAMNMPMVISSDDPAFWEVLPLSHDFYMAFLGIASSHSDLRTLKKLATNSIKYSSIDNANLELAYQKWQYKWDQFIDDLIKNAETF